MKDKEVILVVDDSDLNRSILSDMLEDEYEILEAADGVEAVALLQKHGAEIDLVLLDIMMPRMDGFEVLAVMHRHHWIDTIPVIMISAETASSAIERAYDLGVSDFISRPFDVFIVRRRVVNTLMLYAKQKKLMGLVEDQIIAKERSNNLMVSILSHIVEFRNGESGLHVLHIRVLTEMLLKTLCNKTDQYNLTHKDIDLISLASALHDIGKIGIDEKILNKPGKLTLEEYTEMKKHSMLGAQMLEELPFKEEPLIKVAYEICRWHHERYDGKGYPDGLKGDEIPISAQIVSLADVYDALTSERVYKKAYSHEVAIQMILNNECGTFNPIVLECLTDSADQIQEELQANTVGSSAEVEIHKAAEEMMRHNEVSASERTLKLLEWERIKYDFYASYTKDIMFEYSAESDILTIPKWCAEEYGIDEAIVTPDYNLSMDKLMGTNTWERLNKKLRETTPDSPLVEFQYSIVWNGKPRNISVIARSMWSMEEPYKYIGAIGKLVDSEEV